MTGLAIQMIQATVARVSHCIDAKRWDDLRALFADEVDSDYTSLFGGTRRTSASCRCTRRDASAKCSSVSRARVRLTLEAGEGRQAA